MHEHISHASSTFSLDLLSYEARVRGLWILHVLPVLDIKAFSCLKL